jgi:hypothetical protein
MLVVHKNPGIGQVGAGVLSSPMEPIKNGIIGFAEELKVKNLTAQPVSVSKILTVFFRINY